MKRFNKKGVIIITIGIICVLIFFVTFSILNKGNSAKEHEKLLKDIHTSAYKYGLDNIDYFKQGYEMYLSIDSLVTNGYLKSNDKTQTLYIDNLTKTPFTGVIHIYYKDNEIHTEYLEDYSEIEKENLLKKDLSIAINNVTSNSISVLVNGKNLTINKYEYYIDDLKIKDSSSNQYVYNNLPYSTYRIKVIAYSENQTYEDSVIVSLTQIPLPEFSIKDNFLTITYPDNVNNYIYKYSFDKINWVYTSNKVEKISIGSNSIVYAEVTDGYNSVIATKEIKQVNNKSEEKKSYTVTFDLNGGTGNIQNQSIISGGTVSKPRDPVKQGYEFIGWYLNDNLYNFYSQVSSNIILKAKYTAINQNNENLFSSVTPVLNYNFSSLSNGKWIFINNPEALSEEYLTDNSGKSLYSSYINGNAEIYYEHYIKTNMNYGIRFYNPTSSTVTLKINKCGSSLVRGNGDVYIDTWKEYYGYKNCSMNEKIFNIFPNNSITIYISAYSTGSGWSDWDSTYVTTVPSGSIPESVIDGVFNVTSSGKLNVESFAFKNVNTIPNTSYSSSVNYIDNDKNKLVYSGYYDKLPFLTADIKFDITDSTPRGILKIKYNQNSQERDIWYTHLSFNDSDVFQGDLIKPITTNNPVTNWGNWAVHYTENIIINNQSNSTKSIAYYVGSASANESSGMASALVAFPKNNSLNYTYKRNIIGKWHTNRNFEKVWEIKVPANTKITVPTEVLLGGNSSGKIGRKVELLN